jgi:hypothetical protein
VQLRVEVSFGTAHLFGVVDGSTSATLLDGAVEAGFRRVDTAPSYGFGGSEPAVGLLRRRHPQLLVTTKVGLAPGERPSGRRALVGRAIDRLPDRLRQQVRDRGSADPSEPTGRFGVEVVRTSVAESVRRLGHLDRLLLHEVSPADLTDDLLALLQRFQQVGDVGELGVGTATSVTVSALARGDGLLTVGQLPAGPFAEPVVPPGVTIVGHGLLGAGGRDLGRLRQVLSRDAAAREAWGRAVAGTAWGGPDGLATALLQRPHRLGLAEVVVASGRPAALPALAAMGADPGVEVGRWDALEALLARASATTW